MKGNKERILFLRAYLEEHTDDDHYITTEELISLYKENGYKAQRQTIADDITALCSSGFEVIINQVTRNKSKTNAYHIGARLFELPEIRLLVDAVSSSRFITAEKSEMLINKLLRLMNVENRNGITARLYTTDRLKTTNRNVLVNIDTVYRAICDRKKITFHYWDHVPGKGKVLNLNREDYTVSPYALIWNDDRYYMPSYSDKHRGMVKYRIDRMCDVQILEEEACINSDFNVAEYSKKAIKMFDDNLPEKMVTLRCLNDLMKNVLDRFGEEIKTTTVDKGTFRARVPVVPSSTFFGWVMQYKGGILIERPVEVKRDYEEMLSAILAKQSGL